MIGLFARHKKLFGALFFLLLISGLVLLIQKQVSTTGSDADQAGSTPKTNQASAQPEDPSQNKKVDSILTKKLEEWAKSNSGDFGIVVREVTGDQRTATYQADKQFISASTYKLFVTFTVLSWVEKGQLSLDAQVVNGKDIPACLDSLLLYSSDECGWPMGNLVGWSQLHDFLHQQGFSSTDINNYDASGNFVGDKYSTVTDESEIAWRLQAGTLLNKTHTEMVLSRLKKQIWRERVPSGVPEGIVVADKPGWLYDMQNDTAIVYGGKTTYVIAVMSKGSSTQKLAELSKLVYEHLN